jgi:hypothetical protein
MNRKEEYQDERWQSRAAEIRKLDHYKCAMCGAKDVELHVHHLSYPPTPYHIWDSADNELVTLCKDCHEKVHMGGKRPILLPDRTLICECIYVTDNSGERMVMHPLYSELCLRGYNGNPYTQQIIDWLREKWLFIHLEPCINYMREDGTESERCQGFCTTAELTEIRGSCGHIIGNFEDYGEAEIEAIRFAIDFI